MADDARTITITIKAANLTDADARAAAASVLGVSDKVTGMGNATKQATAAGHGFSSSLGVMKGALGALGIGMSVTAMVNFGKSLVDGAGALVDMSAKTGNSIEQLQRWAFVGKQAGVTTEQFADAAFKLGVKIADGPASVRGAVEQLGLEYPKTQSAAPRRAIRHGRRGA